jgi:Zn-dependent protease
VSTEADRVLTCPRCQQPLDAGSLVCDRCRALVYAGELEATSQRARRHEEESRYADASEEWRSALERLPAESKQAAWIRNHLSDLQHAASAVADADSSLGVPTEPAPVNVLPFAASLAAFLAFESFYGGLRFGIGLTAIFLGHELGHFLDVRRRGLSADLPLFLPGFGAFVRFRGVVSPRQRAGISLAGPFAGWLAAAACAIAWRITGAGYWASVAQSGAWLNMANLTPVWVLDGGQAASALSRGQRVMLLIVVLAAWAVTREGVMFVLAVGALYRAAAKDDPAEPDGLMALWFAAVLLLLAGVMYLVPGTGFGIS